MADKRGIISKYAYSEEDTLMLAKVFDKYAACASKNYTQTTRFLTMHDCVISEMALRGERAQRYTFWGGYDGAERRIIVFYPDYFDEEDALEAADLKAVRARFRAGTVTHRDILGSLMNIGISRECIGDLLIHEDFCDIICLSETLEFIMNNLLRAGRETIKLEALDDAPAAKEEKFKMIKDTVASLRLDAIVSSGCSMSRGNAAALISSGKVKLNGLEVIKPDKTVTVGDSISVRGFGRIMLEKTGGESRKGRTIIEIKKYL